MPLLSSDDFFHAAISCPGADHFFLQKEENGTMPHWSIQPVMYAFDEEETNLSEEHKRKKKELGEIFEQALKETFGKEVSLLACLGRKTLTSLTPTDINKVLKIAENTLARNALLEEQGLILSSEYLLLTQYLSELEKIAPLEQLLTDTHQSFIDALDHYESEVHELNTLRKTERLNVLREKAEVLLKIPPNSIFPSQFIHPELTAKNSHKEIFQKKKNFSKSILASWKKVHQKLFKGLQEELKCYHAQLLELTHQLV